jgi:hypothetical protein
MNNAKIYVNAWNAINNCSLCLPNTAYSNISSLARVYNSVALDFDQFAASNPDFLSVLAAGRESCPSAPSSGVCQIAGPGNAKNVITVGASMTTKQSFSLMMSNYSNFFQDNQNYSGTGFPSVWNIDGSSYVGPATNSRKKPDVYAPGSHIISMNPVETLVFSTSSCQTTSRTASIGTVASDLGYDYVSFGSSNAAAVVGGMLAVVRDWFSKGYYSENNDNTGSTVRKMNSPSAALMKSMIIHGAVYPPSGTVVQRKVMDQSSYSSGCSATDPRYDTITDVGFGFVRLSNTILITGTKKRIYLPGRANSFADHSNNTLNGTFDDPVFTAGRFQSHRFPLKLTCSWPISHLSFLCKACHLHRSGGPKDYIGLDRQS